jgi:signal transduction histidine kinase
MHILLLRSNLREKLKNGLWVAWRFTVSEMRGNFSGYLVSLASVSLATMLRIGLDPVLGDHHPFTLYFASVAIAAWYGGLGPAVLAIVVSYFAADWFFITPRFEINLPHQNLDEFLALMAFVFSCFAIAITSAIMRRALARSRTKQRELEHQVAERQRAEAALQRAQSQLRQYASLLEHRVQERTAHLQETVHSLEGVCYHLAHDLRAPLRAMEGFTTILLREYSGRLDETASGYLEHISDASQKMDLLIHGLLEFGRMGHADFPLRAVEPKSILETVLDKLGKEISVKRAEVRLGGHWPEVVANEELLEIVFFNLLTNALKFLPAGLPPRISLHSELTGDAGQLARQVRFVIEDNGIGMPPEQISRAFWIFERLHPRQDYPGTGIGLAIVSKAIERMDGRLGAESRSNAGSRFWFELPAAVLEPLAEVEPQSPRERAFADRLN